MDKQFLEINENGEVMKLKDISTILKEKISDKEKDLKSFDLKGKIEAIEAKWTSLFSDIQVLREEIKEIREHISKVKLEITKIINDVENKK